MSDRSQQAEIPLRPILHVGRIARAHGLKGEVKVHLLTSDPDRFSGLNHCLLVSADEKQVREVEISGTRPLMTQVILKLQGVEDRSQAESLRGWFLSVRREQAIPLPENQWFVCDLMGCSVHDQVFGDLGTIGEILQNSAQDVYLVRLPGQPDLLFPALKSILAAVDIPGRRVEVRLPEGLYEIYRERKS